MSIILSVVLMAALCASPIVIVAQAPAPTSKPPVKASTPRTPWGDPDLQGTYTTDRKIYEYACHEGNLGLANMMSGARADERVAAAKK